MPQNVHELRPGLRFAHLRSIVRLRQSGPWLGITAFITLLAFHQLHRHDPALFERSSTYASQRTAAVPAVSSTHLH